MGDVRGGGSKTGEYSINALKDKSQAVARQHQLESWVTAWRDSSNAIALNAVLSGKNERCFAVIIPLVGVDVFPSVRKRSVRSGLGSKAADQGFFCGGPSSDKR